LATKLKSNYRIFILIGLLAMAINGILVGLNNHDQFLRRDYFSSVEMQDSAREFAQVLHDVVIAPSQEEIKVTESDIFNYRNNLGTSVEEQTARINEDYAWRIEQARNQDASEEEITTLEQERDSLIDNLNRINTDDEYVASIIRKERIQQIENNRQALLSRFNILSQVFTYNVTDHRSGQVFENESSNGGGFLFSTNYENIFPEQSSITGMIGVSRNNTNLSLLPNYSWFNRSQSAYYTYTVLGLIALALAFVFRKFLYVKSNIYTSISQWIAKQPFDLRILFFIFGLYRLDDYARSLPIFYNTMSLSSVVTYVIGLILIGLLIAIGKTIYNNFRDNDFKNILLTKIVRTGIVLGKDFKTSLSGKSIGKQIFSFILIFFIALPIILFGGNILIRGMIWDELELVGVGIVITAIGLLLVYACLRYVLNSIKNFEQVKSSLDALAKNGSVSNIEIPKDSTFSTVAKDISMISANLSQSQIDKMKSDALKTELIANVSHDLRTPLTSIITYTDLLKQENISEEDRTKYIDVIDKKSKKLKVLIDDLFDVSKMMSGDVKIHPMKVDIVQLFQQSLAEYDEELNKAKLDVQVTYNKKPIYVEVDGNKFSRVFDNLISNVLKYTQKDTRVYANFSEENNEVVFTLKNISKYKLDDNVEDLFERFKRGDKSRSTTGSGLGLAIALSIVELHGGQLTLDSDGDLFKATLTLNENETKKEKELPSYAKAHLNYVNELVNYKPETSK